MDYVAVGRRIRAQRKKLSLSQEELAEMVNISTVHMSHIETGRSFPKADLIEKFAEALNVEYTKLFKTEHLQDKGTLLKQINSLLQKASDEELKNVYKIVNNLLD